MCQLCADHEVKEIIDQVVEVRQKGHPTVNMLQLWKRIREKYPRITIAANTMRHHVAHHTKGWNVKTRD